MTRMVVALLLLTLISCSTNDSERGPASTDRPPQYVLLSFDGSKSLRMWNEILNFADQLEDEGRPVKYSFFVSGVYFVTSKDKNLYTPQGLNGSRYLSQGQSAIGWADSKEGIQKRIEFMNRAVRSGHEIGSHAVGHFSGHKWTHSEWMNEFSEFNDLVFNWKRNNRIGGDNLIISQDDIKGFRAPQLGVSGGLWTTLRDFNYSYDTSESKDYTLWPVLGSTSGAWNIRLGFMPIVNTSSRTIAMDYNFYFRHKKQTNPSTLKFYEDQVYESYMNYFYKSYYGNRAPVVIGHHFSLWNQGIYWNAFKKFARAVCGQREVECITHKDFSDRMSSTPKATFAKYRRGDFPRYTRRKTSDPEYLKIKARKIYDLRAKVKPYEAGVTFQVEGEDKDLPYDYQFKFNNTAISGKKLLELADHMKQNNVTRALLESQVSHNDNIVSSEVRAVKLNDKGTIDIAPKSFVEYHSNDHHLAHDQEPDIDKMMEHYLNNSIE